MTRKLSDASPHIKKRLKVNVECIKVNILYLAFRIPKKKTILDVFYGKFKTLWMRAV